MKKWVVQYEIPVDNPLYNVRMTVGEGVVTFSVPANTPDAHRLTFADLIGIAMHNEVIHKSGVVLNNKIVVEKGISNNPDP